MPPKKPKKGERRESDTEFHLPLMAPPTAVDHKEWYRVASDIMDVKGKYEEEDAAALEAETSFIQHDRVEWSNQVEFLMSCIATSVGLGNVWRFPFIAYKNGGGAFLIPYLIVLVVIGKPMYYLECLLGQFSSRNSVRVWSLSPAMKGTGYSQTLGILYIVSYYVSIVALCLHYLVNSFKSPLPWATCKPEWEDCVPSNSKADGSKPNSENSTSSAEFYFINDVLQQKPTIHDGLGAPVWYLVLCLLASWIIIFLIVARGVKSSGKAAYFLALFPYVVMLILLVSTAVLPGASKGMLFFVKPHWGRLLEIHVWYEAVTQVFFSLTVGTGPIVMFSSYNSFRANVHRDSLIVTTLDTFTSLLSGITIFGILGNLAYVMNAKIEDVVGTGGSGLAFISYPDAIAKSVMPQVFSVLFFLMMVVLGIGSAVAFLSTINTVFLDAFPNTRAIYITILNCFLGFLSGLIYVTPGGQYILELVDYYGATFLSLFCAICEIIGVIWIYGLENVCLDLEYMLGQKTSMYWRICWGIISPVMMIVVFVYALFNFRAIDYGGYIYPNSAYAAGYFILLLGMIWVPLFIFIQLHREKTGTCCQKLKRIFSPKPTWGPRDRKHRRRWQDFKDKAKRHQTSMTTSKCKHICYSLTGAYRRGMNRDSSESDINLNKSKAKSAKDTKKSLDDKNDKDKDNNKDNNTDKGKSDLNKSANEASADANNPFQGRRSAPTPYQPRGAASTHQGGRDWSQSMAQIQNNPQNRSSPQTPTSEQSASSDPNSPPERRKPKPNEPRNPDNDDDEVAGPSSQGRR